MLKKNESLNGMISSPLNPSDIFSARYWQSTCPSLKIESEGTYLGGHIDVRESVLELEAERMERDGYFQLCSILDIESINKLKHGITQLEKNNIPPLFISLFDEFWTLLASLQPIGERLLGGEYRFFPEYWVWKIEPMNGGAGWKPHRESKVLSNDPNFPAVSMTYWVSISDSTTDNGCMYLLPKSLDKGYPHTLKFDVDTLQSIKALPVPKASVIGWNQSVFHWGSRSTGYSKIPRISLAIELGKINENLNFEDSIPPNYIPSFNQRLRLVANQVKNYQHLQVSSNDLKDICDTILSRL